MPILTQYPALSIIQQIANVRKCSVYLVGGFLRDHYLGREGTDMDFAVSGHAIAFAREFARRIKGAFVLLDDVHGSARIVKNTDGLVWTYDFTDFRGATIHADLKLRDFTVNTLRLDVLKLKADSQIEAAVIDKLGVLKDLKLKKVRLVSAKAFVDDPLRLLRAYSLQAAWGLSIEAKTLAQIKKDKDLIAKPAMERVREEIFKVLASPRAYDTLAAMDKIGLLPKVMPQLAVMHGVDQGGYHHLDVWKHSLEVLRQLDIILDEASRDAMVAAYLDTMIGGGHNRRSLLKLAALLHDIGKPQTRKPDGKRMTFHSHEHVGAGITRVVAKHLKLTVKERYFLEDAVRLHLRPGYLSNFKNPSSKAVFRYFRDTGMEAAAIAFLALADQAATCGPLTTKAKHAHHAKICRMLIARFFEVKQKAAPQARLLTGHDLIKKFKLKPSPLFGKILTTLDEAQSLGKVNTRDEALALAQKMIKT